MICESSNQRGAGGDQLVAAKTRLAVLRRRNCEVKGGEMWEVLGKEAGKWQGRAFEALSALDDCAAQSLARVRRRRLVLVSPE